MAVRLPISDFRVTTRIGPGVDNIKESGSRIMKTISSKPNYNVGDLVSVAYQEATRATRNRTLAGLVASKIVEDWLARSDRPDLAEKLQADEILSRVFATDNNRARAHRQALRLTA
jgi:hypothetical protein